MSRVSTSHNSSSLRAGSRGLPAGSQSARGLAASTLHRIAFLFATRARDLKVSLFAGTGRADPRSMKIAIVGAFDLLDSEIKL